MYNVIGSHTDVMYSIIKADMSTLGCGFVLHLSRLHVILHVHTYIVLIIL